MPTSQPLFTRRTALAALAALLVFAAVMHLEGRPAWCKSGLALCTGAWSHCTSQNFVDPYTLTHITHGVLFFAFLWPLRNRVALSTRCLIALGIELGWELFENTDFVIQRYREQTASLDYYGDSVLNSLGDVAAMIAGFALASRFSWKASLTLIIALELVTLLLARDNLTLNILMLLHPFEAIKQWQLPG